ncbi:MAG: hypothetical protein ACU4EQ_10645 [Candidatus Nitrosoglobus sp.]
MGQFASTSKASSKWGTYQQGMSLKAWEWGCPDCSTYPDGDINTAKNILKFTTVGERRSLSSAGSGKNPKGRSLAVVQGWQ